MCTPCRSCCSWLAVFILVSAPAAAQNWQADARRIAIGGTGGSSGVAEQLLAGQRDYRVIVLPIGLLQVLRDFDTFNPDSDEFDIIKAIEYASSPLHYVIGRDNTESDAGRQFTVDIANATLSRDLNAYRGFVPANQPVAEGLASPSWGVTVPVARDSESSHAIFVGAGPYLSMRTALSVDERIIDILGSDTDVYFPNAQLQLGNDTRAQVALALTGGYRGRFAAGTAASERDGIYTAVDYHYLRGFRYEDIGTQLRLETDGSGLLAFNPGGLPPLLVTRSHANSGQGFAIDIGVAAIVSGWEAGFGINGIANRIRWDDVRQRAHVLGDLFSGNDELLEAPEIAVGDVEVELPVDYRLHGGYHSDAWSALAEYGHGFQDDSFRGGFEYRLGAVDLRGGGVYSRERWHPTGGIGFNVGPRVSLDLAIFGTSANVERERRTAIAASLRFNRR